MTDSTEDGADREPGLTPSQPAFLVKIETDWSRCWLNEGEQYLIAQARDVRDAVEIVERLAQAKSRQDVAATMAVYHSDGVLESPPLGGHYIPDLVVRREREPSRDRAFNLGPAAALVRAS